MGTPQEALKLMLEEREARKAVMQTSNWIAAAEGGSREYIPVSSTPLDQSYQRSKSVTRSDYLARLQTQSEANRAKRDAYAPAGAYIASKTRPPPAPVGQVLGYDERSSSTSNTAYGESLHMPSESIDLLQTVPKLRDTTLDGAHRASMTETHFLTIWDPYDSKHPERSGSFQSAAQLREAYGRHVRSQFAPHEKYVLPPTVQSDMGWDLTLDKYKDSCAKFQEGASWHGRKASHITRFSERLLLGARHHLSGPMTKPALHY
jgi:hypothetical protein